MGGEKITAAKEALLSFIDQIQGGREKVALVAFNDEVEERVALGTLTENRASLKSSITSLQANGATALYDAVIYAHDQLQEQSDPERINAIVVMTDGQNTRGSHSLEDILSQVAAAGTPVLIFAVAYGEDADMQILQQIAEAGDGQAYTSDPETVRRLYERIVQFF
jgi:Ca-activated chloride channel family protein